MNAFQKGLGGAALCLVLAAGLAAPAMAQKLDNKKNEPAASVATDIDFGDDSSQWSNDGECDDPRFAGAGSAAELVDADILKDATDCRAAYEAGTVTIAGGEAAPAIAASNDIDFGDNSSQWSNDGECDDPRFAGAGSAAELVDADILKDANDCRSAYAAGTVTFQGGSSDEAIATSDAIDFGDDSSEWNNDGECDDPRFEGSGSAAETIDADLRKDATDCRAAYEAGTVTLKDAGTSGPAASDAAIDFGDDSSQWSNDGECDDPRFSGTGSASELVDADILKDATDCQAAYAAGTVQFVGGTAAIDFGDDSSEWANDGECDDPRFSGTGSASELVAEDTLKDASDCRAAYDAGTVRFVGGAADIDYGDNASQWSNDGECDDPRFSGSGVAGELLDEDLGHDAADCRAAVEAGTATYNDTYSAQPAAFDYGSDWSDWANDGECDDLRFTGPGTDKKLLSDDMYGDATDCSTLEAQGQVSIRKVYSPEYAAGAPYDSSHIEFGDNKSDYADDDRCDDPRFEGPGAASVLLDSDEYHDSADCKAGYEAGTIILSSEAE